MIFQWRGANDTWASHSKVTGRRVKGVLHRMILTKCAKDEDRDRRRCAETEYCPRTLSAA